MRQRDWLTYIPLSCLLTILLLALFTWAGSVYGLEVVNLLSAEGIRWMFSSVVPNITRSPLPILLLTLMALSALDGSGMLDAVRGHTNSKQKNAMVIALLFLTLSAVAIACMTLLPGAPLLNPLGTLSALVTIGIFGARLLRLRTLTILLALASRFVTVALFLTVGCFLDSPLGILDFLQDTTAH